jgi:predicted XRE-type DNA-binding protein
MSSKVKIYSSCGNVFADIGHPHPERALARSEMMFRITQIIKEKGWTQKQAAAVLGIPQSKVSCLMRGKLSMFSLDHLFDLLNALDRKVEIIIKPKGKHEKFATTQVIMAAS